MPGYHMTAPVKRLAEKMGVPRHVITRRAGVLGCRKMTKKESNWSPGEISILERNAHKSPEVIYRHMLKKGYRRSVVGIVLKRKRMRFVQNIEGDSARSLAQCLGVDEHSVIRYIKRGLLRAGRRGTDRTAAQGGDIYFIRPKAVREFIIENVSILDFRKMDKFWLTDILTGNGYGFEG